MAWIGYDLRVPPHVHAMVEHHRGLVSDPAMLERHLRTLSGDNQRAPDPSEILDMAQLDTNGIRLERVPPHRRPVST